MKKILRSKSDTNIFFEKEYLDAFQVNMKKINEKKVFNVSNEAREKFNLGHTRRNLNWKMSEEKNCFEVINSRKKELETRAKETKNKQSFKSLNSDGREDIKEKEIFFNYSLRNILRLKVELDKNFFEKIKYEKLHVNLLLEVILIKFKNMRNNKFSELKANKIFENSFYESPVSTLIFNPERIENNLIEESRLNEKFENFENLLEILISTSPEELFREIKFLLLNEFERITLEIQMNLEKSNNERLTKIFAWTSQSILFIISIINYKLEFFSLSINSLIDKLNNNILDYIKNISDNEMERKEFATNINIIHKYIQVKKYFIREFCFNNSLNSAMSENANLNEYKHPGIMDLKINANETLTMNKFSLNNLNSFGRFFFNNYHMIINNEKNAINLGKNLHARSCNNKKKMRKIKQLISDKQFIFNNSLKNNYFVHIDNDLEKLTFAGAPDTSKKYLEDSFKFYFTFKLANWNYTSIKNENLKKNNEICRICETSFSISDFILHIHFCKDQRLYMTKLYEINRELSACYDKLKQYKEGITPESDVCKLKDMLFSPKWDLTRKLQAFIDQTPKFKFRNLTTSKKIEKERENDKSEIQLFDALIDYLFEEKDQKFEDFEKNPQKLSRLLSIIQLVLFFLRNKNQNEIIISNDLFSKFIKILEILVKKILFIENLLNLKYNKDRARMKMKNFYLKMNPNNKYILTTPISATDNKDPSVFKTNTSKIRDSSNFISKNDPYYISPNSEKDSANMFMKMLNITRNKFHSKTTKLSFNPKSPNLFGKVTPNQIQTKVQNKSNNANNNTFLFRGKETSKTIINPNANKNINNLQALRSLNFNKQEGQILNNKIQNTNITTNLPNQLLDEPSYTTKEIDEKKKLNNKNKIKEIGKELKSFTSKDNPNNLNSKFPHNNNFRIIRESVGNETLATLTTGINPGTLTNNTPYTNLKKSNNFENYSNFSNHPFIPCPDSPIVFYVNEVSDIESNFDNMDNKFLSNNISEVRDKSLIHTNQKNDYKKTHNKIFESTTENYILAEDIKESEDDYTETPNLTNINKVISFTDSLDNTRKEDFILTKPNLNYFQNYGDEMDDSSVMGNEDDDDSQLNVIIDLFEEIRPKSEYEMTVIKDENELDSSDSSITAKFDYKNQMKISDFKFITDIAKGGYGRVDIYKKISTGDIYAIKTVNIENMKSKKISGLLKNETLIFNEIFSEYVVKCFRMFSDDKNYFYVMEYMKGGNLLSLLNTYTIYSQTIQLIVAEVILGLEYLHSKDIIHRDLKPENILISYEGHFKLTDFGISEVGGNQNKYAISMNNFENNFKNFSINTKTILGTEHYLAPEVLKNEIITSQVDYWSLGVLIFELFTNTLPFFSEKFSSINDNILNLKINWEPFDLLPGDKFFNKSEAKDLINKFLNLDPNIRWGYRDLVLIKKHAFFKQFDWDNIKNVNDVIIKKHVLSQINTMNEKIKKGNQTTITQGTKNELNLIKNQNIDDTLLLNKNNSLDDPNETLINENDLLNSERVDNLYLICQDVIKINFKHKTFKRETDSNFLDMLNELNN